MLFEEVDDTICERDADVDIRISFQKGADDRQNVQSSENNRRRDNEFATRGTVFSRCGSLCFDEVFQNFATCSDVGLSGVGQFQAATTPIEQARMEMSLEFGHFPADRRKRHTEPTGASGETARVRHGQKNRHSIEAVHLISHIPVG